MSKVVKKSGCHAILRRSTLIAMFSVLEGCGGTSVVQSKASDYADHSIRTLAIAPPSSLFANDSSQLADAVGAELAKHGYTVVDSMQTAAHLARLNIPPANVLGAPALAALEHEGIDAVFTVQSIGSVMGGPGMRHAKARVFSTHLSKQIAEVDWNNAWGGMPGSLADYTMRKGLEGASREIADDLAKLLG